RAGLARGVLRPLRRAGGGERGGDGLPRIAPLSPLRREAALRARLLVALRRGRRAARRLRGAPEHRDRDALPRGRVPLRHGRGVLLGGLPPRLDPLDAAPLAPRGGDRRGLVAEPRDRRALARALLRSEEHTSELQSPDHLVCRLLLEKKTRRT